MTTPDPIPHAESPIDLDDLSELERHSLREPLDRTAAVHVVHLVRSNGAESSNTSKVEESLKRLLGSRQRRFVYRRVSIDPANGMGFSEAIREGLVGLDAPIVLITTVQTAWTANTLLPLVESLDRTDHVIAEPSTTRLSRFMRSLRAWPINAVFAIGTSELPPIALVSRAEKLRMLHCQSRSGFALLELIARANDAKHVLTKAPIPALDAEAFPIAWGDLKRLYLQPDFSETARLVPANMG